MDVSMRLSLTLFLVLMLSACSIFSSKDDKSAKTDEAEEIYAKAKEQMERADYTAAIKHFETLQSRFPYGRYAQQAQMETAYAYYKLNETESALSAADRYIKQYPNSPGVDYLYYLKGLVNFDDDLGYFGYVAEEIQPDMSERNPKAPREAFDAFNELITRFPNSKYTPDAKVRMQYLVNALARHETQIAGYYLRRGAYVGALNRANAVLIDYPMTPATLDALQIMIQAYDGMGMKELRDDTQRVLDLNVAKGGLKPAIQQSAAHKKPWWNFWK